MLNPVEAKRQKTYEELLPLIGEEGVRAFKEHMDTLGEELFVWLAGLWEPRIGGFYYSNSARDEDCFLPDVESTAQALGWMEGCSMFEDYGDDYAKALPKEMLRSILNFTKGLQSPEDGYFYHPQWGKDVKLSRRSRDLGWALGIIKTMGDIPFYDSPSGVKGSLGAPSELIPEEGAQTKTNTLPPQLQSVEALREYLDGLDIYHRSYNGGNDLSALRSELAAAGPEIVRYVFDYLNAMQNPENGLWSDACDYHAVNGFMKIGMVYTYFKEPLPNYEQAIMSAIRAVTSDEVPTGITSIYNPWVCISATIDTVRASHGDAEADRLRAIVRANAAEMIRATSKKLLPYRKPDGGYSYCVECSSWTSQGAPVARKNEPESDVNATSIATNGTLRCMCLALDIPRPQLFCGENFKKFLELINEKK